MENENDEECILNNQEESDSNAGDSVENTEGEEQEDIDYKALYEREKEIARNQKIRAEKAEERAKKPEVKTQSSKKDNELSTMDIIALSKANIDTEDMPEVLEYAKFKGISISEALKSPLIKATIQERVEMRNVASATNTGAARRSSGKVSDETLIANASKGNLPENDDDIDRLVKAKMFKKK